MGFFNERVCLRLFFAQKFFFLPQPVLVWVQKCFDHYSLGAQTIAQWKWKYKTKLVFAGEKKNRKQMTAIAFKKTNQNTL